MQQLRLSQTPPSPSFPPPPTLPAINNKNNRGPVSNWGVAAEIFQNAGMNLLHPGTQEAHIHMHFYLRPITATQEAEKLLYQCFAVHIHLLSESILFCCCPFNAQSTQHFKKIFLCGSPSSDQIMWGLLRESTTTNLKLFRTFSYGRAQSLIAFLHRTCPCIQLSTRTKWIKPGE